MSTGSDDNDRELPDTTHRMPGSGGSGSRRPVGPSSPPPPAEAFRPAGPPQPADSYRPGRPLNPTDGTPQPVRPDSPAGPTRQNPYGRPYAPPGSGGPDGSGAPGGSGAPDGSGGSGWNDRSSSGTGDWAGNASPGPYGAGVGAGPYGASPDSYDRGQNLGRRGGQLPGDVGQPPPGPTRAQDDARPRRRWPKRLAIIAGVLLILLVVVDRVVASVVVPKVMKDQIAVSLAETNTDPNVPPPTITEASIQGFPFLTQVLFGNYKDIRVGIAGITTPGPRISQVKARLQGLHLPLGDAIRDSAKTLPVDQVDATAFVTYDDFNAWLRTETADDTFSNVQLKPVDGGQKVEASGEIDALGFGAQTVTGVASFSVTDGHLQLKFSELGVGGTFNFSIPLDGIPGIDLPVPTLPFDLRIIEAGTTDTGVSLTARANNVVLPAQ